MIDIIIKIFILFELVRIIFTVLLILFLLYTNIENKDDYLRDFTNSKKTIISSFTDYTSLRCLSKKGCCYTNFTIKIIYSVILIYLLNYILKSKKYNLFVFYFIIYISVWLLKKILMYKFISNPEQIELMCPNTHIDLFNSKYSS